MLRRHSLIAAALVAACTPHSSALDRVERTPDAAPHGDHDDFDIPGLLAKIKQNVEKPGPYEAPDQSSDFTAGKPHWSVLELSGDIVERSAFSLTGGRGTELRGLIDHLHELATDATQQGLVLRVGAVHASVPDLVELRDAVHQLRAAKKQVRCFAMNADNATYLLLAACDSIGMAPLGDLALTGPAAMPIHVKGLLDKLGVTADFIHIGAYKGAAEPLTRDSPSKEMDETLGAILDQRYATMVDAIAADRHLDPATVKSLIDTGLFTSEQAKAAKLVDSVEPFDAFRDEIKAPWHVLELDEPDALGAYMKLARFLGAMPAAHPLGDHVALVYAVGNIVDGEGKGMLGAREQIAADTLVPALHALAASPTVKAVVLRVDSGGGSAQASELIWRAIAELRAKKPVIVSMSDVAASGGYYISSGATKIYALPDTLTGSIGVVGGHLALEDALQKLGVTTFPMGRGKHATMMASFGPWTADERATIEGSMRDVYQTFVGRVADGRHQSPDAIDKIAQGRVWTGAKAKELGLVDELGGLDAALADAQKLGKVDANVALEVYPPEPTLRDVLHGIAGVQAPFGLGASSGIDASSGLGASSGALDALACAFEQLDPHIAAAAERLVGLALSFRETAVQTVSIDAAAIVP